jgi:putative ABC transport system permease protein
MNLFTISLRNLQRRPFRALVFSIVFIAGLTAVVGLHYVSKDIGQSMETQLARFGANVVILPQENNHTISYGGVSLGSLSYAVTYLDQAETVNAVRSIEFDENISAVAPKLIEVTDINGSSVMLVGVDWQEELFINSAWDIMPADVNVPIYTAVGYKTAQAAGLAQGDTFQFAGSTLKVDHVLAPTGGDADSLVFTSLANMQAITGKPNAVNFIEVSALCSACPIEDIVAQISANTNAEVKALQSVVKQRMYSIEFVETLVWCIIAVILSASILMMALFMLSAVNERKKEIGIMRAIGYSKLSIFSAICAEATILLAISGVVGYFAGYFAGLKILSIMEIDILQRQIPIADMFATIGVAMAIAILASALPALKAARLNPAEALNRL